MRASTTRTKGAIYILMTATLVLSACGALWAAQGSQGRANSDPSHVATAYATYLFASHRSAARSLVEPESRSTFDVVAASVGIGSFARELSAGSTTLHGPANASVELTGTICVVPRTPVPKRRCVSNADPDSMNPIFRVDLAKAAGRWFVTYNQGFEGDPNWK